MTDALLEVEGFYVATCRSITHKDETALKKLQPVIYEGTVAWEALMDIWENLTAKLESERSQVRWDVSTRSPGDLADRRRKQVLSTAAGRVRAPATCVKLFNPKHKHQPLTCFKKRYSWMTAEPKQTKWEARRESNWPSSVVAAARVTLPLPVSVVGVCCCVNYSSSRSRRREQPLWNRFKWNVPPGRKQLPSSPAGEGFRQPHSGSPTVRADTCEPRTLVPLKRGRNQDARLGAEPGGRRAERNKAPLAPPEGHVWHGRESALFSFPDCFVQSSWELAGGSGRREAACFIWTHKHQTDRSYDVMDSLSTSEESDRAVRVQVIKENTSKATGQEVRNENVDPSSHSTNVVTPPCKFHALRGKAIFRIVQGQGGKGSPRETGESGTVSVYEELPWRWKAAIWVLQRAAYLFFTGAMPIHQDNSGPALEERRWIERHMKARSKGLGDILDLWGEGKDEEFLEASSSYRASSSTGRGCVPSSSFWVVDAGAKQQFVTALPPGHSRTLYLGLTFLFTIDLCQETAWLPPSGGGAAGSTCIWEPSIAFREQGMHRNQAPIW
ncbi:hypothetical protein P7K49_004635 [Saguinus oedipus]|uniref:Uncharacterized protein n=1 Tax=Saguinus oedipus TaxID=9490 RepID=A0ABQ9W804_SAGOE|nr:hypothetical protein P7K49_004635 [Saguinus oedipus]